MREVLNSEYEAVGRFAVYSKISSREKLSTLFKALLRAEEIAIANLAKSLGEDPYKVCREMSARFDEEARRFVELYREEMEKREKRVAVNLRFLSSIKKSIAEILEFPEDFKALYVCPVCGYVVRDEVPEACPLCNTAGDSFERYEA